MSTQNKALFKIERRDGSSWKRLLLTWINNCEFFDRHYYNIEQTNIYEFFNKYQEQIPNWPNCQLDLVSFLKEYYPAVDLHSDDDNQLSSSDYMYIYSILLHFSCVKYPTEFFQKICQSFHELYQQAIATFFKGLLGKHAIDKALLRKMIAEASLQNFSSIPIESPIKTPQNCKISPPTPKTFMLEEKNRELHILKASLETEKYEKGFLELQNKQYEEKIKKLEKEHQHYITEVHELRSRINLENNFDNYSSDKTNWNDQQKNRLKKVINEKDDLIFNLRQNMDSLNEEKNLSSEKLKYAQKEINVCLFKISELEIERCKFLEEMEKKDQNIQFLHETKKELEDILSETRSQNGRLVDLNNSLEYLDLSSSHNSNSSGGLSSPENLGRSVVDIQLREKECENIFLKGEIDKMQNDNAKLSKHISELIRQNYEIFDICQENLIADENAKDITQNFIIFENYFTKLVENYKQANKNIKQFQETKFSLNFQIQNLGEKINGLEKLITDCRDIIQNDNIRKEIKLGASTNIKMELIDYIENSNKELFAKKHVIKNLTENNSKISIILLKILQSENEFSKTVQITINELKTKCAKLDDILNDNYDLKQKIENMKFEIQNYQKRINGLETTNSDLKTEKLNLIINNEESLKFLRCEIEECNKNLKISFEDCKNKKLEIQNLTENNLIEKDKLTLQIKNLNEVILNIKQDFCKTNVEKSKEIEKISKILNERNFDIENLVRKNSEYAKITNDLENVINELKTKLEQLQNECFEMEEVKIALETENQTLSRKIDETKLTLEISKNEEKSLKQENEILRENYNKNSKEILEKQILLENMEKKIDDQKIEFSKFQNVIENFEIKEKSVALENEILQQKFTTALENIKILEEKLLQEENKLTTQSKEISTLQEKITLSQDQERNLNLKTLNLMQCLDESSENIRCLKTEIEKLELQSKNQISEICRLEMNISQQTDEKNQLNLLLNQRDSEIVNLQSIFDKLKTEYDYKDLENKNLINELNCSKIKLNSFETELQKLKEILPKLEKENLEFSNTIESLTICKMNAEDEIEEWKSKSDAKNNELKKVNEDYQNNLNKIIKQIENNIENYLETEILVNFLESTLSCDSTVFRLNNSINALLNNNTILLKKKEDFEQNLSDLNSNLQIALETKNDLETRLNDYEKKYKDLENNFVQLNELMNSEKTECSAKISNINNKMKSLEDENKVLKDKFNLQKEEFDCLNKEKNLLVLKVSEIENINKECLQQIDCLTNEMRSLKETYENNIKQKELSLEEISLNLQNECKKNKLFENDFQELKKKNDGLQLENKKLVENYETIQEEKQIISKELIEKNQEIENMKVVSEQLNEKNNEIQDFRHQLRNMQNKIKLLNEEKNQLSEQNLTIIEELKSSVLNLKNKDTDLSVLNTKFEEKIKEFEELQNENLKITTQNWELKCIRDDLSEKLKSKTDEVDNSRGNLEILEKQCNELQDKTNNLNQIIEDLKKKSDIMQNEVIRDLEKQLESACEENSTLNDKISKISIKLDVTNEQFLNTKTELENCRHELNTYENNNKILENSVNNYKFKIEELQSEKDVMISENNREKNVLTENLQKLKDLLQKNENKAKEHFKQLELSKSKLESETIEKLKKDLEIFHAKLLKSRQLHEECENKMVEEKKRFEKLSDDKIKENRIELEGKLEKMKNKMKTLYNDEVTKLKKKYENEIFDYQAENQVLKGKCEKYDQHNKTLSKRVLILNERVCELERDNKFMECKLKDYSQYNRNSLRPQRPHSSVLTAPPLANFLGSNLRMEDEEGEIFNNTYLADMKDGRISDYGVRDSISTQELQYRNSLAPPHLRSAYLAQYKDNQLTEEDIKDGMPPIDLDDSLTSLMSGYRKKVAGTTSYKKPGPPTPSKSGGRLSFGTSSEVHASILKEYNDNEHKKTPAKFKLFSSRSNIKDEQNQNSSLLLQPQRKSSISRKFSLSRSLAKNFSSTPRKSKIYFDNRRLLENIMNESKVNQGVNDNNDECDKKKHLKEDCESDGKENVIKKSNLLKENKLKSSPFLNWRPSIKIYSSESGTSDTNSPNLNNRKSTQIKSVNKNINQNIQKESEDDQTMVKTIKLKRRISIYHRGNVYARSKLPSHVLKEQIRIKSKLERNQNFNKYRTSLNEIRLRKSLLILDSDQKVNIQSNNDIAVNFTIPESDLLCSNENVIRTTNKESIKLNDSETRLSEIFDTDIQNYNNFIFNDNINDNIDLDLFEKKITENYNNPSFSDIGVNENKISISNSSNNDNNSTFQNDIGIDRLIMNSTTTSSNSNITQLNSSNKTVYASSNIVSRKIPQINSTMVSRKSSFYFKNGQCILIANEALSFFDVIKLWFNQSDVFKTNKYHYYLAGIFVIAAIIFYITL